MRIGILTFHCAHNYGAVLQCYALQQHLLKNGHSVEVIDYRPKCITDVYRLFPKYRFPFNQPLRALYHLLYELFVSLPRWYKFNSFQQRHLIMSKHVEANEIPSDYDAYIIGSDQLWNTEITGEWLKPYFAQFPFPKETKRYITYGVSFGSTIIDLERLNILNDYLSVFDNISLREDTNVPILSSICHTKLRVVLDPTLLLSKEEWENIIMKPRIKKKYVLAYQVRYNEDFNRLVQAIARKLNLGVVEIGAYALTNAKGDKHAISPGEFLGWIKNATFIVTSSFHATVFSILFNKDFYSVALGQKSDIRYTSLLRKLGLEKRIISHDNNDDFVIESVDYHCISNKLLELNRSSRDFLEQAIYGN